jgi:hypothetical protein
LEGGHALASLSVTHSHKPREQIIPSILAVAALVNQTIHKRVEHPQGLSKLAIPWRREARRQCHSGPHAVVEMLKHGGQSLTDGLEFVIGVVAE